MSSIALSLLDELRPELTKLIQDAVAAVIKEDGGKKYPEKVSVVQASEITGFTKNSLYQMHAKGTIPGARKVGGKLLFDTATLRKWVDEGGRAA